MSYVSKSRKIHNQFLIITVKLQIIIQLMVLPSNGHFENIQIVLKWVSLGATKR